MKFFVSALVILFSLNSIAADPKVSAAAKVYAETGKKLLTAINSGKVASAEAEALVKQMEKSAVEVIDLYAAKDPAAKKLVTYLKSNISALYAASSDELQKDWHDAGKLTKDKVGLDLKDEANEKYLDPCHVLLHPIMTLRAIKDNKLGPAKEELNEGLEQMAAIEKAI